MHRICPFFAWLAALLPLSAAAQPAINAASAFGDTVGLYHKFELDVDIAAVYDNPFDPDQVALGAVFTAPDGGQRRVDAFYYRDFSLDSGRPQPRGPAGWRLRFAPDQTGPWRYTLHLRDANGEAAPFEGAFTCIQADAPGFLRRDEGPFLRFDDGSAFFAVGQNMSWGNFDNPLEDYSRWLGRMAAAGGNYIRPWMASWAFGIEWDGGGLGEYGARLGRAHLLDGLFELAREHGVYLQLVLNNHGQFSTRTNPEWENNPYNAANGGPCVAPRDFYTDPQARALFKRRLRYIVARWGYSPQLLAWELFNEVDLTDGYEENRDAVAAWHAEMAAELKRLDPNGHLVTTSLSGDTPTANGPDAALWDLKDIDLTQVHYYVPGGDQVGAQRELVDGFRRSYGKPSLIGEFCFTDAATARRLDPEGVYLHNALWASAFSGAYGAASIWWWDHYIEPLDLYHRFSGVAAFMADAELGDAAWRPTTPGSQSALGDLSLAPGFGFGRAPSERFEVLPGGGSQPAASELGGFLFGATWNTENRRPPTFAVDYAEEGLFAVRTAGDSGQDPTIEIWLDGEKLLDSPALAATTYAIQVPAGRHEIRVDNRGTDWIRIESYAFSGYTPRLRAHALQAPGRAIGWVQNRDHNWRYLQDTGTPDPIDGGRIVLHDLERDGSYRVDWYRTADARFQASTTANAVEGRLEIAVPALEWDLAFKAAYAGPPATAVVAEARPQRLTLEQNYPNPFNSQTTIRYLLDRQTPVRLQIFDILGRRVATLQDGPQPAGAYRAAWDGRDLEGRPAASGPYFYRLETASQTTTRKMSLIR